MTFDEILPKLKAGKKVYRNEFPAFKMWLEAMDDKKVLIEQNLHGYHGVVYSMEVEDILADDWSEE